MFAVHSLFASVWLVALLVAWAALLLGSVVASFLSRQRMTTWLRLASSAILVLAAWSWYLVARDTSTVAEFALLVALGMTLGFVGDLLLADVLPVTQGFLAGMGAFALGHIAYIAAILSLTPQVQWAVAGIALLIGLAGWYAVVFRGGKDAMLLRWAALPYALLLATTAGVATGLAIQMPVFLPLALGAALFLASDLLVAGRQFGRMRFPHSGDAVWLTYGPAQMLIVYAVNSALVAATLH
ncbi:MAG TPA: lysoplasmalogenase family protein [Ktedonobacterales bacterium]|nr:lysoplasmalogenase family protein [Ktedonobacterales bacterium]